MGTKTLMVLDTHVLIWFIEGDAKLGRAACDHIDMALQGNEALIPAICVWEVAWLAHRERIALSLDTRVWIDLVLRTASFRLVPLEPAIAVRSVELEWRHRDPADRFIVATAQEIEATIMTADRKILDYAAQGHVQAIDARR